MKKEHLLFLVLSVLLFSVEYFTVKNVVIVLRTIIRLVIGFTVLNVLKKWQSKKQKEWEEDSYALISLCLDSIVFLLVYFFWAYFYLGSSLLYILYLAYILPNVISTLSKSYKKDGISIVMLVTVVVQFFLFKAFFFVMSPSYLFLNIALLLISILFYVKENTDITFTVKQYFGCFVLMIVASCVAVSWVYGKDYLLARFNPSMNSLIEYTYSVFKNVWNNSVIMGQGSTIAIESMSCVYSSTSMYILYKYGFLMYYLYMIMSILYCITSTKIVKDMYSSKKDVFYVLLMVALTLSSLSSASSVFGKNMMSSFVTIYYIVMLYQYFRNKKEGGRNKL